MKVINIVVCLLFLQSTLFSQVLVVPSKKWEGIYLANPDNYFQSQFRPELQLIEGVEYFELMFKVHEGWFEGVNQYYRQENDKVYRLYEGEEKLIFDFGLSVGDTIKITDNFGDRFDFFPIRTTDTLIFNKQLRKLEMRVKPENKPVSTVPHVWIEGVGDTGFFFGNGFVFGNQNSSPIFCVRDNGHFYSAGIQCPDLISNVNLIDFEEPSFIYYSSTKVLEVRKIATSRLDLYSISGERLQSYDIDEHNNKIDISSVHQQICVVVLFDGQSYSSKMLKL